MESNFVFVHYFYITSYLHKNRTNFDTEAGGFNLRSVEKIRTVLLNEDKIGIDVTIIKILNFFVLKHYWC